MLRLVAVLIVANTYTQVITPELTGQSIDCYLTPATASRLAGGEPPPAAAPVPDSGASANSLTFPLRVAEWLASQGGGFGVSTVGRGQGSFKAGEGIPADLFPVKNANLTGNNYRTSEDPTRCGRISPL